MKTAKDLELLLLIKEHEKQKLQLRIKQAIEYLEEVVIVRHDEVSDIEHVVAILDGVYENDED